MNYVTNVICDPENWKCYVSQYDMEKLAAALGTEPKLDVLIPAVLETNAYDFPPVLESEVFRQLLKRAHGFAQPCDLATSIANPRNWTQQKLAHVEQRSGCKLCHMKQTEAVAYISRQLAGKSLECEPENENDLLDFIATLLRVESPIEHKVTKRGNELALA